MSITETISTDVERETRIYTQEENYRAYKLFSMMDVDSGGSVSLRELYRVLMGDAVRYVSCDFDHPDTGIVWGLDEEACVAVVDIEEGSLALNYPFLIKRMRIHSINNEIIPQHDPKALELVYSILLRLHDDAVTLEFLEPMIVINKFSCVMDLEVDNKVYPIYLPVGAVYNLDVFKRNLMKEMVKVNPYLRHIKVDFFHRKRQIFFKSKLFSFRLLFLSGPNNRRSCRYALGFNAEDTPLANYHIGQPMLIDLNLGLDREKTEILMVELFNKYDRDGSGEFEFEEFRDFYIRYLDTDESLDYLRKYAKHRFRDIEHEKMVRREQLERENRARRRAYLKVKYHDLIEAQKAKFKAQSVVDRYGNRRRLYTHRTGYNAKAAAQKARLERKEALAARRAATPDTGKVEDVEEEEDEHLGDFDDEHSVEERKDASAAAGSGSGQQLLVTQDSQLGHSTVAGDTATTFGGTKAVKLRPGQLPPVSLKRAASATSLHSQPESAVTDPTLEHDDDSNVLSDPMSRREAARNLRLAVANGAITAEEAQNIRREQAKKRQEQKQLRQKQRRKQVLKMILEANKALNRAEKIDAKKFKENNTNMYLMEAHAVIKRALLKSFRMKGTDYEQTNEISWDVSNVVASPALTIDSAILGLAVDLDNVNLTDLDSKHMHPAGLKYFFIRESKKKGAEFNAKVCHPAFFCSDFERAPTRHSRIAISIAKIIANKRAEGERFREERGIKRVTATPPEDELPDKYADRPKKVRFLIDYKDPVTAATVVARLTVLSMRVQGLPSIHLVEDNSPFVELRCGQFRFSTEVNALAGKQAMWDDLNWMFRLHHGDSLTLTVLSGTAVSAKTVGGLTLSAQDITSLQPDAERQITLSGKLVDQGERVGSIEVDVFIEHGNEWDWHVAQYKKEQDRLHTKLHTIKKFSRTFHGEDYDITFPLAITISGLTLLDMKSMHRLKNNRPYIELSCGTTQERSSVQENVSDSCTWDDVRWRVTLVSENANLIFLVYSEKVSMGRFTITGEELSRLHRDKNNVVEVVGDVVLGADFTAKICFKCKLHQTTDASSYLTSTSIAEESLGMQEEKTVDYSKDVQLPCVVTLHAIELTELPQVNPLKANSPQVVVTCGYFSSTTRPASNAGHTALWTEMDVNFPIQDKLHIEWKVFSAFTEIGTMVLRAAELTKIPRDRNGVQIITRDLHNGKDVCGKVSVALSYSLEGRSYTVGKQLAKLQQQAYKEPTIAGYGNLPLSESINSMNETTEVVLDRFNSVAGNVLYYDSRSITAESYPFRFTVTDIIANDLKSAHLLVKNSPSVRIVCGTMSASTKEVPRAGASAIWAGLSAVVFLQANSSVRVSVFSKDVCIGYQTVDCAHILDCTPDVGGNREAFLTICDEGGKTTGKLKLTFVLEAVGSYTAAPVPFDTSELRKGLEPPILVTIRTISLISLRKVHKYSSNSPFVKAKCGKWQGATTVLDYAGRDAKWRDMNWEFVVHKDTPLSLTVMSGTIVIGKKVLSPDDILEQNPNNQGLCELTGTLVDSEGRTIEAGQVRITYSYEAHVDDNSVNSDTDSEADVPGGPVAMVDAPNNFLTLDGSTASRSGVESSLGHRSSTLRSIGHIHLLSINASSLSPVHTLTANSPYLKISCDDYRAVTTTLYRAGATAEWKDLLISFGITRKSVISLQAVSGEVTIGDLTVAVKDLLALPPNDAGHTEHKAPLFKDGKLAGQVTLLLHIDRLNRYGFGNSAVLPEDVFHATAADRRLPTPVGEESLDLDAKTYQSHDISASPITLPFVLRIVRVIALDVHPDLRVHFEGGAATLRVRLDSWSKSTPSCTVSGPPTNLAEWVDSAWVFVITNPAAPLEIAVMSGLQIVGDLRIAMGDVVAVQPSPRGLVELPLYLFRGGQMPCGKVKVCVCIAPYSAPEQVRQDYMEMSVQRARTPARIVGFLRIKFIRVSDLMQVYGLFPNSPKVSITFGSYRNSTPVATDAGSDYTWSDLGWGRVPIVEGATFIAKVTSGNEVLGTFQVSALDLFALSAKSSTAAILVEGDVMDGGYCKGRFEMQCIPNRAMEPIEEDRDGETAGELPSGRLQDAGVGAQVSWVSSNSAVSDPALDTSGSVPRSPHHPGLSASTPTPDITVVALVGVSVFDLKPLSAVFRNSPQVQFSCDTWYKETTVARFAGASADWILKRGASWEARMRANTFLKLTVVSSGAVVGTVCISTREWVEVPRDAQGLTTLVRDIEHNTELTGRVRIMANLTFLKEDPVVKVSAPPSLMTNSFGLPSLASYYPIQKKPSVSNSVIRGEVRGAQEGSMVAANTFALDLPVNVHLMGVVCEGIAPSLIASANVLTLVVKGSGDILLRSQPETNTDKHVEWEDLDWDIPILADDSPVNFSVQSSLGQVGDLTLPVQELLSAPRTSQGFVELVRSLRVMGSSGVKLHLSMLLTPHLSSEQRELFAQQIEEDLQQELTKLPKLADMHVELISVVDISPVYGSLNLAFSAGAFAVKDCLTFNVSGCAVWGSLPWQDIPLFERTNIVMTVSSGDTVLGKALMTAADLVSCPVDNNGLAVIYGELLDGLTYKGTLSMTFRLFEPEKAAPLTLAQIDTTGAVMVAPDDPAVAAELVTSIVLHAASAKSLKPVHKVGKNSPMLKIEVRGLKFQSNSVPYGGNKAEWTDLLWSMKSSPVSKVKVMVTSGSVVIGTATTTTKEIMDKFEGKKEAFVTLDLVKNGDFMGVITLLLRVETKPHPRGAMIASPGRILQEPENPYHLPSVTSDSVGDTSVSAHEDGAVAGGAALANLDETLQLFHAHQQPAADEVSLQSVRSLESLQTTSTGDSSWTGAMSSSKDPRSVASGGASLRLPSVGEEQVLPDEVLGTGRSSARSAASHASGGSKASSAGSSTSRPKTSRGGDETGAGKTSAPSSARSEGPAARLSISGGSATAPSRAGSQQEAPAAQAAPAALVSGDGSAKTADSRTIYTDDSDSHSTSSFSIDTVNSSYVYHSADIADYRERTIHTIRETSEASSTSSHRQYSGSRSSRSEDSSTAFDSSVSHSSPDASLDRSIYSESNSLSSSAYTYSVGPNSQETDNRSRSTSEFGTEVASSSMSVDTRSHSIAHSSSVSFGPRSQSPAGSLSLDSQQSGSLVSGSVVSESSQSYSRQSPVSQSFSASEATNSLYTPASPTASQDPSSQVSVSLASSQPRSFYTASAESRAARSGQHVSSRVSGNTASFLLETRRSAAGRPPQPRSVSGTSQGTPQSSKERSAGQQAWTGADASTIATESDYSFSETGSDRSDASSEYSESSYTGSSWTSSRASSSAGSSRSSEHSLEPSRAARSIYSGYDSNPLGGGSERYSDYTSGSSTSRTSRSSHSSYSGDEYTPRSAYSEASRSSQNSAASKHSTQSGVAAPAEPAASLPPSALHSKVVVVGPRRVFNPAGLRWLPFRASLPLAASFTAQRFVSSLLTGVVRSFVAMEAGGDFSPAAAAGAFITFSTDRRGVIKDLAFIVVRNVITTSASNVLTRQLAAVPVVEAVVPVPASAVPEAFPPGSKKESAKNPFLDGTFKKRAGIRLTGEQTGLLALTSGSAVDRDVDSDEDPIYGGLTNKGKVESPVPQKARITFQDILSIDLSFLDPRVMPKRPYLTVCKPYGNWAAETGPAWRSLEGMTLSDLVLNWYDLSGTLRWERFVLRRGQFLVFDLHDAGSGLLFAKARLPYSTIINRYMSTNCEEVTVFLEFDIANEYGGGKLGGVARMQLDLSVNVFVRSKKSVEFWDTHRSEHWTNFPIAPISTGKVRQKYREIASDYDKQKVIHPCFFGFRVRWRGNPEDEARFVHPMFRGFTLTKKPVPKKLASELSKNMQKDAKPNPWRWDANAAALGRCPVCTDGISGCPRCFMFPLHKNGFPSTAAEFAYDPDRERAKQRERERKEIQIALKRKRRLERMKLNATTGTFEEGSLGSLSAEHESDDGDEHSEFTSTGSHYENANDPKMTLHTNLTTYKSLRAYRNVVQKLMTVYVKLIPTGYVRKFVVDSSDTIFHLYNMYNSHSNYGTMHSSMLLIPTIVGMFELHPELAVESDLLMAVKRGRDTLGDYGLNERNGTVVMLFIPNYKKEYVPKYLSTFFEKNTDFSLKQLPMYDSVERLPPSITGDVVQKYLRGLLEVEYAKQQSDMLREFVQRGLSYHQSRDARAAIDMKKMKERSVEALKEKNALKLRMESQLKGLTGAERKAAKIALKKRELQKKRSVLYEKEKAEFDMQVSEKKVLERRAKSSGTAGSGGLGSTKSDGLDSSRTSSSGDSSADSSEYSEGSEEGSEDSSSDATSSSDSGSDVSSDSSEEGRPRTPGSAGAGGAGEAGDEEDEFAEGPDVESRPILSPRGDRPGSGRSDRSSDSTRSQRKFYVVGEAPGPGSSAGSLTSSYTSYVTDTTSLTESSHISTGTGGPSTSAESLGSSTSRSYDTYDSGSQWTGSDGSYTSRSLGSYASMESGSTYGSYSSYTSRTASSRGSSASSSRSYYSDSASSYVTADSQASGSSYTGSYTGSYASYESASSYSDYSSGSSAYSSSAPSGQPYHQGSSLHSLFSGLTEPPSVHSSQASGPTAPTFFSNLPPSKAGSVGLPSLAEESSRSSHLSSSYTSFVYADSQPSSSRGSDSTGGLFTYRSQLDSLPSSRSGSSGYFSRDSLRSASSGSQSSRSDSSDSRSYVTASSQYSSSYTRSSRPSSASHSTYSDSTYQSQVSEVSEASSYELYPQEGAQPPNPSAAQSQTSQSRGTSSAEQQTKTTLFSRNYSSTSASSYNSGGSRSYGSYTSSGGGPYSSHASSFRSDYSGDSGSLHSSASSSGTAPSYDDISMYSSEVRTKASNTSSVDDSSTRDDNSEFSETSAGAKTLFSSESGSANKYPSGAKYRHNQFPVPDVRFQASQESLRDRFVKMKKPRLELQQSQYRSVEVTSSEGEDQDSATTTTVQVPNFYADGSPIRPKRTVTPPKTSTAGTGRSEGSVGSVGSASVGTMDSRSYASTRSAARSRSRIGSTSTATLSQSDDYSDSTYTTQRQKRRLMPSQHQPSRWEDSSQATLDSSRSSADSTYSGDGSSDFSSYTAGSASSSSYSHSYSQSSQVTADSSVTGASASFDSPRGGFVQRKRAHMQQAASFDERSYTSSGTGLSDPLGSHILSHGSQSSQSMSHSHSRSDGPRQPQRRYVSDSDSEFFAVSEDSASFYGGSSTASEEVRRGHGMSTESYDSSSVQSGFVSATSSVMQGSSSGAGSSTYGRQPHRTSSDNTSWPPQQPAHASNRPQHQHQHQHRPVGRAEPHHEYRRSGSDSGSVGSHDSSSSGTVDYLFRSDVLSSDGRDADGMEGDSWLDGSSSSRRT